MYDKATIQYDDLHYSQFRKRNNSLYRMYAKTKEKDIHRKVPRLSLSGYEFVVSADAGAQRRMSGGVGMVTSEIGLRCITTA